MPLARTGKVKYYKTTGTGQELYVNQTAAKMMCRPLQDKFPVADALVNVHSKVKL